MTEQPFGFEYLEEIDPCDVSAIRGLSMYGSGGGDGSVIITTTGPTKTATGSDASQDDGGSD